MHESDDANNYDALATTHNHSNLLAANTEQPTGPPGTPFDDPPTHVFSMDPCATNDDPCVDHPPHAAFGILFASDDCDDAKPESVNHPTHAAFGFLSALSDCHATKPESTNVLKSAPTLPAVTIANVPAVNSTCQEHVQVLTESAIDSIHCSANDCNTAPVAKHDCNLLLVAHMFATTRCSPADIHHDVGIFSPADICWLLSDCPPPLFIMAVHPLHAQQNARFTPTRSSLDLPAAGKAAPMHDH